MTDTMTNEELIAIEGDLQGRRYARLSDMKPGMLVQVDDSFIDTSGPGYDYEIPPWSIRMVKLHPNGYLGIDSTVGGEPVLLPLEHRAHPEHFGAGNDGDENDALIGVYRAGIKLDMAERFQRDGGEGLLGRLRDIANQIDPDAKLSLTRDGNVRIRFSDGSRFM